MLKVNYKVEVDNVLMEEKTNFTINPKKDNLLKGVEDYINTLSKKEPSDIIGKKQKLILSPTEAYGHYQTNLVGSIPKELNKGIKTGDNILITLKNDKTYNGVVKKEVNDHYVVDCNHPLADKTLRVELEITDI